MSGLPRRPLARFEQFTPPTRTRERNRTCTLHATHLLVHSTDRKAVVETTRKGTVGPRGGAVRVLLCADCQSYIEAFLWARANGCEITAEMQLLTLSLVWRAKAGYRLPPLRGCGMGIRTYSNVSRGLAVLTKMGLLCRSGDSYRMRDACPACYQRTECAPECGLSMTAPDFSPRRYNVL